VYPQGPWRPRDGVQRGSVADMPRYPGDPLTPGVGATPGAKRLSLAEAQTITKIPVLPISYGDAQPLLAALRGPMAPDAWRGALPLTYRIGPGPAKVHLRVKSDWSTKPLYDVIARLPGASAADQWIMRGNHHDAWVNGAQDPISGLVPLLEEARALGQLARQGWKPRRTIIYAAWDGEEPGLLGSTEWVETHGDELRQHGAVYINSDVNSRGYLLAAGSHALQRVRTCRQEIAPAVDVGVDVDRSVLPQLVPVRLDPLGRAEQARLLAVPGGVDDRAPRLPPLARELSQRARLLEQRHEPRDGILRAVHPGVVMIAPHDPLVRRARAREPRDHVVQR